MQDPDARLQPAWEPTMVTLEGALQERVKQLEGEVEFLREVLRALVERRGPVRLT